MRVEFTNDCWLWLGSKTKDGYGVVTLFRKQFRVHRLLYLIFKGKLGERVVRHTCDNPSCVNPHHLEKGTHLDNVKDRVDRRRSATGTSNGRSKVDREKTALVEKGISEGFTISDLAKKFKVDGRIIRQIRDKKHWTQK